MIKDCCSQPGLMLPVDALARMRAEVEAITETEWVELENCFGRTLAEDVVAAIDLPPFANSSMDGYAIRSAEVTAGTTMTVAGKAFAGIPFEGECPAGQCVRIMTGALLPQGLDTVVMQENTEANGDQVTFLYDSKHQQFVRQCGSELAAGTTVLRVGQRISPTEIGVLATVGVAKVKVFRQLIVALFSTGDELKAPGTPLSAGEIYDSNRHALRNMLEQMQVKVVDLGVISDDIDEVRAAFTKADEIADVVVTSGGVSVGEADFIKIILDEMGKVNFWKLAIKPGKPFAFGRLPNSIFCGLPGNPVSSMVTCYELVQPLLSHLGGEQQKAPLLFNATLTTPLKKGPGRQEYQRGVLTQAEDGSLQVAATGAQSSDMTTSMSRANCFIVLPRDKVDPAAGEIVSVEPFNAVLGGL